MSEVLDLDRERIRRAIPRGKALPIHLTQRWRDLRSAVRDACVAAADAGMTVDEIARLLRATADCAEGRDGGVA